MKNSGCCGPRAERSPCCVGGEAAPEAVERSESFPGRIETPSVGAARVSTDLSISERLGMLRMRLGWGRSRYRVEPGLYAVGEPDADSPVLVSANYKMSFDVLRSNLGDRDLWILVIDTRGINVWCSAGKGTFSAAEIARMADLVGLKRVVNHRRLVLPQLSGPGVAAHEVIRLTGFKVIYGPVRAADIREFLDNGLEATPSMRRVRFGIADRLVLTPVELTGGWKLIAGAVLIVYLAAGWNRTGYSVWMAATDGSRAAVDLLGAFLAGALLTPILLPWIPFRSFALKGSLMGLLWALLVLPSSILPAAASLLILPAVAGFAALNFTGATTFTSPSGVRKELRYAVPIFIASFSAGVCLLVVPKLFKIFS